VVVVIARWLRVTAPIPYTLDGPGGSPIPCALLPPTMPYDDGRVGESYITLLVGRLSVARLVLAGDLVDLGTTYDAPPTQGAFYRYRWPDETPCRPS
jgi:hypothetical protein